MKGTLTLISSKNPPVFGLDPIAVEFTVKPRTGEPFLFTSPGYGFCHTSDVKLTAVDSETGDMLITTRNSLYRLSFKKAGQRRIVGISGKRGSGKDLLSSYLKKHGFIQTPFAGELKERVRRDFGLTREHTDGALKEAPTDYGVSPREIMIAYGQFFRRFDPLYWVKSVFDKNLDDDIVISDVRFKNEADYVLSHGGILVRIERDPALNIYKGVINDPSETDLDDYGFFDLRLPAEKNIAPEDLEAFAKEIVAYINDRSAC